MSDFWSRRREQVAAEEKAEALAREQAAREAELAALEEKSDEELLEELGLPDPDSLTMDDDFKPFMDASVPLRLRNRALRKLWRSNPVLACVDGLNDYDEDFTDAARSLEPVKTVYQVGKGMLARFEKEAEEQAAGGKEEPLAADLPETSETRDTDETPEPSGAPGDAVAFTSSDSAGSEQGSAEAMIPADDRSNADEYGHARPSRRMRFTFEGAAT